MSRTQKAYHIGENLRSPYPFPDMTRQSKPYMIGFLTPTRFLSPCFEIKISKFRLLLLIQLYLTTISQEIKKVIRHNNIFDILSNSGESTIFKIAFK